MNRTSDYWRQRGWQWRPGRGESFVLETWETRCISVKGAELCLYNGWERQGMVYRAHRGDRWVYRNDRTKKSHAAPHLRTAMRLGVFFTLLEKRK